MPFDLERFRREYPEAMAELREAEGWTSADMDEVDAAVTAAYQRAEPHELACWANWVSTYARRRRRRLIEAAEARLVHVIPLMSPAELERLQQSRATAAAAPAHYRGRKLQ